MPKKPFILQSVLRGLRKKCPRCGRGKLFRRWFTVHERCTHCDLQFERSPGDTWGFWIIGDRIVIAAIVAGIFLGYRPTSRIEQALLAAAAIAALIYTMPHRQGICIALDYILHTWTGHEHTEQTATTETTPQAPSEAES